MKSRQIGMEQEKRAVQYLQQQGYQVIEQNYWTRFAEIDIVAKEEPYLCFIEVKYRSGTKYGAPEGVITQKKKQRIKKATAFYLAERNILMNTPMRFDVVLIIGDKITLIRNAFGWNGDMCF